MRLRGENGITGSRRPVLTVAATAVAVVAGLVQYAVPAVVPVLERAPDAPQEWWRWMTSLLVQTLGVHQMLGNLVTLALVGFIAERLLGRARWVLLFVAGTAGGQVAAFVQGEPGGGSSIAICGLAGGVLVALLADTGPVPRLPAQVVSFYVVALTGWGLGGFRGVGLAVLLATVGLLAVRLTGRFDADRVGLWGAVVCTGVLAAVGDLHGVSLASGAAVMVLTRMIELRQRARRISG